MTFSSAHLFSAVLATMALSLPHAAEAQPRPLRNIYTVDQSAVTNLNGRAYLTVDQPLSVTIGRAHFVAGSVATPSHVCLSTTLPATVEQGDNWPAGVEFAAAQSRHQLPCDPGETRIRFEHMPTTDLNLKVTINSTAAGYDRNKPFAIKGILFNLKGASRVSTSEYWTRVAGDNNPSAPVTAPAPVRPAPARPQAPVPPVTPSKPVTPPVRVPVPPVAKPDPVVPQPSLPQPPVAEDRPVDHVESPNAPETGQGQPAPIAPVAPAPVAPVPGAPAPLSPEAGAPGTAPTPADPPAQELPALDTPDPEVVERPQSIPTAPEAPPVPAPVSAATTSVAQPVVRASHWADTVVPATETVDTVLIGRDNLFADSLASGGLQGLLDAPLLLNASERLSGETKASLKRLNPKRVVLLGGEAAQSKAVEAELVSLGYAVSRVAGATRIETAAQAANTFAPKANAMVLARAYAANGGSGTQAFADALGGGALAASKEQPLLLTQTETLSEPVATYIQSAGVSQVTLLGGHAAISPVVEQQLRDLGVQVTRLSGATRAQTAVRIAQSQGYWHAGEAQSVLMVNGEAEDAWTDAFPAALYAKRYAVPVVYANNASTSKETQAWLRPGQTGKDQTRVICGYSVSSNQHCQYGPGKAK